MTGLDYILLAALSVIVGGYLTFVWAAIYR